ncbi:MAG: hypothetical protein OEZ06_20375 [Myxococcales bacterium]|nr:hypothetical protein [Myxococcales bacterium]
MRRPFHAPIAIAIATFAAALLWAPGDAQAQRSRAPDNYGAVTLLLGFGGEAEYDSQNVNVNVQGQSDLEASLGLGGRYMAPLHKHFALGGALGFLSWQTNARDNNNLDRSSLLDLSLVPAGVLPVGRDLELYLSLPLGLTLGFGNEEAAASAGGVTMATVETDPGVGLNLGLMFGLRVPVSGSIGFLGELGFSYHAFSQDVTSRITVLGNTTSTTAEVDVSMGQLAMNLGIFF